MVIWKPTHDEIADILALHRKWLSGEDGGARADLADASLAGANLAGANLARANLARANLARANLARADLAGAYLAGAYLARADLAGADLAGANLARADLAGAKNAGAALAMTEIVPREGEFAAWKRLADNAIAKLLVPKDAKRSNATGRKCRCSKALVLGIWDEDGVEVEAAMSEGIGDAIPIEYRVGKMVEADSWDEDRLVECGHGIHFYLTSEEAENA